MVEKAMGGLLIVAGVAFFSGWITDLGSWLIEAFPELGKLAI
jgi:cytochrome c-type biogenesis protein